MTLSDAVTRKVAINVNLKGLGDIQAQDDAFILDAQEIPAKVLDCISMGLPRIADKPSTLVHCISNLWASRLLQKVKLAKDATVVPLLLKRRAIQIPAKDSRARISLVLCFGLW
jgi:hypothetical protein